ncbi:MAG TPA: sigma 54-interacting transcriptional regulator [Candidatus Polarisedimenticolaceae bacterium]|nr:sigma 54-interacting transcriptional regulator [Candidatus Polarisedimenticolaceae bacterium]
MSSSLADALARVAAALRLAAPFDQAEIAVADEADGVRAFRLAAVPGGEIAEARRSRADYPPPLWPEAGPVVADGSLVLPLRVGERVCGVLRLSSGAPGAFSAGRVAAVEPVADLLALALEQDRLWTREQRLQQRRQKLEALLPMIAGALDVRKVFLGMSRIIQEVVPHDTLSFSLLTPDRSGVVVQAATAHEFRDMGVYRFSDVREAVDSNWSHFLIHDASYEAEDALRARLSPRDAAEPEWVVLRPGAAWIEIFAQMGLRSSLRVPIRAQDKPLGGLAFSSRQPFAFGEDDIALAQRIADHVALALAHQGMAEEARRTAEADARAAVLAARVNTLTEEVERFSAHRALGKSMPWKQVLADAARVAETETTVLITGESGTGKEVVARYIHRGSPRARGPFVALNCAALPEHLLESELFGHERGAFTGAHLSRGGRLEQAAGGVLFLDEVGEMLPEVQAKLLRVLQEREFQRLGGAKTLKADVRVIAATNRDPRVAMARGTLREDLYYRLSVFEIVLPPLRERPDDILVLADAFLEEIGGSMGRPASGIAPAARELLVAHPWPGNVRELRNVIERSVILSHGGAVLPEHLPAAFSRPARSAPAEGFPAEGVKLEAVERELVERALASARHNKSQAAKLLGLTRGQLYSLLRRYGLTDAKR